MSKQGLDQSFLITLLQHPDNWSLPQRIWKTPFSHVSPVNALSRTQHPLPQLLSSVVQKLFILRSQTYWLHFTVPEPDFILYMIGANTANLHSGHTRSPVLPKHWYLCYLVPHGKTHSTFIYDPPLFFFPKSMIWSLEQSQETDFISLHHPWHSQGSEQKLSIFQNSQSQPIHMEPVHSYQYPGDPPDPTVIVLCHLLSFLSQCKACP